MWKQEQYNKNRYQLGLSEPHHNTPYLSSPIRIPLAENTKKQKRTQKAFHNELFALFILENNAAPLPFPSSHKTRTRESYFRIKGIGGVQGQILEFFQFRHMFKALNIQFSEWAHFYLNSQRLPRYDATKLAPTHAFLGICIGKSPKSPKIFSSVINFFGGW